MTPPETPPKPAGSPEDRRRARKARERRQARALPKDAAGKAIQKRRGPPAQAVDLRPKPKDAPAELVRGTDAYRRWEASRVLGLLAAGMTREGICTSLGITVEEYKDRRELIRREADLGDCILAWTEYRASCSRQVADLERALQAAIDTGNLPAQIAAARALHEIHDDVLQRGLDTGLFTKMSQGTGVLTLAELARRVHSARITVEGVLE